MKQSDRDAGTIAALMKRLKEERLPKAQQLLEKVRAGELLSDADIAFLKRVYEDSRKTRSLVERNPGYTGLASRFIDVYTEIINRAMENEKQA